MLPAGSGKSTLNVFAPARVGTSVIWRVQVGVAAFAWSRRTPPVPEGTETFTVASAARADEIIYFTNGTYMKILAHEVKGDMIKVQMDGNGSMGFPTRMVDKIEKDMGIALTDIKKFNVKGKVLIYKKDGSLVEMKLKTAQEYARPECHHCGDFSAELADISCGGVGAMDWTITILRTERGEALFNRMVAEGLFEVRPMEEFENSMKVLLRLSNRQRARVPIAPGQDASRTRLV